MRPTNRWTPDDKPSAFREVGAFLYELKQGLLDHLDEMAEKDTRKPNEITNKINVFMVKVQSRRDLVLVLTDKNTQST